MTEKPIRRRHQRPRPQTSCSTCHRRKVRCDKQMPCGPCIKHGCLYKCRFEGIQATSLGVLLPTTASNTSKDTSTMRKLYTQSFGTSTKSSSPGSSNDLRGQEMPVSSELPTHDWIVGQHPVRGRTHSSWLWQRFVPLLSCVEDADMPTERSGVSSQSCSRLNSTDTTDLNTLHLQLPADTILYNLVLRYFDTFDTVYAIVDRETFLGELNTMLVDSSATPAHFVAQVLMMVSLANATYLSHKALLPYETTTRWLALVSTLRDQFLYDEQAGLETLRVLALLNLAEQIVRADASSGYLQTGITVRAAMASGIHRLETTSQDGPNYTVYLWKTIVDMDINACLEAGMPPNVPTDLVDGPSSRDDFLSNEPATASDVLSGSLAIRRTIVTTLNTVKHLRFDQAVELGEELAKSMAPNTYKLNTFAFKYLSFVYGRYLAALHRPFALLDNTAFHSSRGMTVRLAKQYVKELEALYQGAGGDDPFAALLVGRGIMFRKEAQQAILILCFEMFQSGDPKSGSLILSPTVEGLISPAALVEDFFNHFPNNHINTAPAKLSSVPTMICAHLNTIKRVARGSAEYDQAMANAGPLACHDSKASNAT